MDQSEELKGLINIAQAESLEFESGCKPTARFEFFENLNLIDRFERISFDQILISC